METFLWTIFHFKKKRKQPCRQNLEKFWQIMVFSILSLFFFHFHDFMVNFFPTKKLFVFQLSQWQPQKTINNKYLGHKKYETNLDILLQNYVINILSTVKPEKDLPNIFIKGCFLRKMKWMIKVMWRLKNIVKPNRTLNLTTNYYFTTNIGKMLSLLVVSYWLASHFADMTSEN
jgi:hypothetical protein